MRKKSLASWMFIAIGIMNAFTSGVMLMLVENMIIGVTFLAATIVFLSAGWVAWTEAPARKEAR
ncbi:hypothetical protein [Thalassobacillus pellis]|uniref:hypothetical protein n=1 Tax=Thalassobacillus pellis TaxID=748008 RepID=UPI001960BF91|nr:hypothetical protein [Thalassobacillus pellis]MBM7552251.1 5-bromo-4-chloroindolyl phosphate hydrolysis protein [Thalassobacillus pellis]